MPTKNRAPLRVTVAEAKSLAAMRCENRVIRDSVQRVSEVDSIGVDSSSRSSPTIRDVANRLSLNAVVVVVVAMSLARDSNCVRGAMTRDEARVSLVVAMVMVVRRREVFVASTPN